MHEIVTIQIGSQSNYVGTHFWNAQESYFTYSGEEESPVDHNVHFQEGIGAGGSDTFTPRALIYDFKGNFGSLRRINALYDELGDQQSQGSIWEGSTVSQRQPMVEPSSYQRSLDDGNEPSEISKSDVRFWSDFNRVFYHPRSIVQVYESDLNLGQRSFNDWSSGEDLFDSLNREEDLLDRDMRLFIEQCDQIQGMQMFTDVANGWAGFTSRYMDRLRDEFGKLSIWVCSLGEPLGETPAIRAAAMVNQARALHELSQQSSIYIPVTTAPRRLPLYVAMDQRHPWHISALQVSGLESILLPTRLKTSDSWDSASLNQLEILLNGENDHRIAQLSFGVGDAIRPLNGTNGSSHSSEPSRRQIPTESTCHLFPGDDILDQGGRNPHCFAAAEVYRGLYAEEADATNDVEGGDFNNRLWSLKLSTTIPMPLPNSFPHIFSTRDRQTPATTVRARLSVSSSIGEWAKSVEQTTRMRVAFDEREEFSNGLRSIAEAYAWDAGISDDDESLDG